MEHDHGRWAFTKGPAGDENRLAGMGIAHWVIW
jgi:hypothetical protein